MSQGKPLTDEERARIRQLLRDGATCTYVCEELHVGAKSVRRIARDMEVVFRRGRLPVGERRPEFTKPRPKSVTPGDWLMRQHYQGGSVPKWRCPTCRGLITTKRCLACDIRERKQQDRELATA